VRILIKLLLIIGCFASAAHAQCGLKNSTSLLFPSDWTTKTPPQKGNSYTDALGCVVTQISDAFSDNGVATTGTISSGALTTMVVGSTAAIFLNRGICIQGAGSTTWSGGTNMLVTYPTAITGTTLTLHDAALGAGTFNVYGCYGFLAHENTMSPFSLNNCYEWLVNSFGSYQGVYATGVCGTPAGTVLVSDATTKIPLFTTGSGVVRWRQDDPNAAIYVGGRTSGPLTGATNQVMNYRIYTPTGSISASSTSLLLSVTCASLSALPTGAEVIIFGAGTAGAKVTTTVSSCTGSTVTIPSSPAIITTVTNALVVFSYSTVQHTFSEYTFTPAPSGPACPGGTAVQCGIIDFTGGHFGMVSPTSIAMLGQLASGLWEMFAYDYVHDVKGPTFILQGTNAAGFTVGTSAPSGATVIDLSKGAGTGGWACLVNQQQICQFTVAGDTQVYTCQLTCGTTAPASGGLIKFADGASNVAVSNFTPALAQNETAGAVVSVFYRPNDATAIGSTYIGVVAPGQGTNTTFAGVDGIDLYTYTPSVMSFHGNSCPASCVTHATFTVDPTNGDPVWMSGVSGSHCSSAPIPPIVVDSAGISAFDLLTGTNSCKFTAISDGVAEEMTCSANGVWCLAGTYDANFVTATSPFLPCTSCLAADLPANPSTRWGVYYNENILFNTVTGDYYRLNYNYSRILEPGGTVVQFWNVPRCGLSYDATLLACDSNFDINVPMGSSDANEPYSDTFLIKTQVPTTTVTPGPATTMFVKANKNMTNPTMTVQYH
jgi:hypothetical protein